MKYKYSDGNGFAEACADGAETAEVLFADAVAAFFHHHGRLLGIVLREMTDERRGGAGDRFGGDCLR